MKITTKTSCNALLMAITTAAPNISTAEPLFNPTIAGNQNGTIGFFGSQKLDVPYKGIAQENYTVSRAQSGLLLTFDLSKVGNLILRRRADESDTSQSNETTSSESGEDSAKTKEQDEGSSKTKKGENSSFSTYYIQAPVSDSAELLGSGALNGNELSGRNHSVGLTYGFGYSGTGMFVFYESELLDEKISYVTNGETATGKLEGHDHTYGLGISLSGGPRFALAGTISYTHSKLKFIRSEASLLSNTVIEQEDKVSRDRRLNFGIMTTFSVLPSLHINLHALTGSKEFVSVMMRYSFQ